MSDVSTPIVWTWPRVKEGLDIAFAGTVPEASKHWTGLPADLGDHLSSPAMTPAMRLRILLALLENIIAKTVAGGPLAPAGSPERAEQQQQRSAYDNAVRLATEVCCATSLPFFFDEAPEASPAEAEENKQRSAAAIKAMIQIVNSAEGPIDSEAVWRTIVFGETEGLGSDGFQRGVAASTLFNDSTDPLTLAKPFLVDFSDEADAATTVAEGEKEEVGKKRSSSSQSRKGEEIFASVKRYRSEEVNVTRAAAALSQLSWLVLTWETFCPTHIRKEEEPSSASVVTGRAAAIQEELIGQITRKKAEATAAGPTEKAAWCLFPREKEYDEDGQPVEDKEGDDGVEKKPFFTHENDYHTLLCIGVKALSRLADHPPYGTDAADPSFVAAKKAWTDAFRAEAPRLLRNIISLVELAFGERLNERQISCLDSPLRAIWRSFGPAEAAALILSAAEAATDESPKAAAFAKAFVAEKSKEQ